MAEDFRTRPRRRGEALETAILDAVNDLLTESGYAALTYEAVAERAGAGKASIYRRWPTRVELALAAARYHVGEQLTPPDTGSLKGDLKAWLRTMADHLTGCVGEALRGVITETFAPDAANDAVPRVPLTPRSFSWAIDQIVEQARRRGECVVVPSPVVRSTPGTLLRYHFLSHGAPIPDDVIDGIVDEVVVPLLTRPPRAKEVCR